MFIFVNAENYKTTTRSLNFLFHSEFYVVCNFVNYFHLILLQKFKQQIEGKNSVWFQNRTNKNQIFSWIILIKISDNILEI